MRQYRRDALHGRIFINHRATQRCRAGAEPLSGPSWTKPDPLQALSKRDAVLNVLSRVRQWQARNPAEAGQRRR